MRCTVPGLNVRQRDGFAFLAFILLSVFVYTSASAQHELDVTAYMADMTLEEKIGQLVIAGFPGYEAGPEVTRIIRDYNVGGIILFARNVQNVEQLHRLNDELQQLAIANGAGIPLFIGIDQEGGTVTRVKDGVTPLLSAMAIGASYNEEHAFRAGYITGRELFVLGINMNFAPVLDVNINPANPVIGLRSFGEDPKEVARLGTAFMKGLQAAGMLATVKHFPGHGDTGTDSHIALPTVPHDAERLQQVEFVPFIEAIEQGVDAVMSAHITFPAIDPTPGMPATLSHRIITGLLRQQLAFPGLIVTDALEMQAITNRYGIAEAAVRAVEAGVDLVLVGWPADWHDVIRVVESLRSAVYTGRLTEERIEQSVERIVRSKVERGIMHSSGPTSRVTELIDTEEARQDMLAIARDAITVVKDDADILPLETNTEESVLLITPRVPDLFPSSTAETRSVLARLMAERAHALQEIVIEAQPTAAQQLAVIEAAQDADVVIVGTYGAAEGQVELVQALHNQAERLIVVALDSPYTLTQFPQISTYVITYGTGALHLTALTDVLSGQHQARGRLPVSIPGLFPAGHGVIWE